MLANKT